MSDLFFDDEHIPKPWAMGLICRTASAPDSGTGTYNTLAPRICAKIGTGNGGSF